MTSSAPYVDLDLFDEASLKNPFADYRRLRDAGALVRLARPDVYAVGRFADVQAALRSPNKLISGEGVGFSDVFNAPKGMNVIQSDGELHNRLRLTVMRPLAPATISKARDDLKVMVAARVDALKGKGWFDAMQELASFLPVQAISHLVGLPEVGRERMLAWAAATFNLIGPNQDPADLRAAMEVRDFIMELAEDSVRDGSWAGELFAATRSGKLSEVEARAAISAYLIPSLDTTILAKGHLLRNLTVNVEQWEAVKAQPDLARAAVIESVRLHSVLRWFSRVAAEDYEVDGAVLPKGARLMVLYGCANRDERRYEDPDRFVVTRDAKDQLSWGTGAHMCAGVHLARLEMEVLVEALIEADAKFEAGEPELGVNAGLHGFTKLPLRIV
ncbi:cytochrome P450 [Vitreimonas sp.]|uniref:cytochrome P450 n=1 Tax=Vitreimonas sp. TaxID=3069702 RepID=UPI002ED84887